MYPYFFVPSYFYTVVLFPCNATVICLAKTVLSAKENCGIRIARGAWSIHRLLTRCFKGTIIVHHVPACLGSFNPWITGPWELLPSKLQLVLPTGAAMSSCMWHYTKNWNLKSTGTVIHPCSPVRAAFLVPSPWRGPQPCLAHAFPQAPGRTRQQVFKSNALKKNKKEPQKSPNEKHTKRFPHPLGNSQH